MLACAAQQVTQRDGAGLLMKRLSPSVWRSGKRPKSDSGETRMEGRKDSENCSLSFEPSVATGGPREEVLLQIRS